MKMDRAYSILEVKRVDDESRIIEGIATTPTPDRLGDIVEPLGIKFKNPLPLLWQHMSQKPVGQVMFGKPTKDGVSFKARIEKLDEPGTLKDRLDEAWQSVKLGLVRAVSIGFRSIERSFIEGGGIRFVQSEVLELSLVTIPANAEATITSVKSIDRALRAASGHTTETAPGATGHKASQRSKGAQTMKTFAEKIADLEALKAPMQARMKALMDEAAEDGDRDLDASEAEEFDGLADDVKEIDTKLTRYRVLDGSASTAKSVRGSDTHEASRSRAADRVAAQVKAPTEKGIGFARAVMCFARAKGIRSEALEIAKNVYPRDREIVSFLKADIPGATTTDPSWAAPLVEPTNLVTEFVDYLRPQTIIGKFGAGNVPSLRRVPFNVKVPVQTSGGAGYWVGEGQAKPLTKFDFTSLTLRWTKVASIAVLSEDLLRFGNPSSELVVRNALAEALVARLDEDFVDKDHAETPDVSPASIINGAQSYVSLGIDAEAVRADIRRMVTFITVTNHIPASSLVFIMRSGQALSLSLMRNALGQKEFPDMTLAGGVLEGIPVIASQHVKQGIVALVSADDIYLADDGGVSIDMSREASLEMVGPTTTSMINDGNSPAASVSAQLVSMFQTNSVAIRAERTITWKRRRSAASVYQTSTGWGNAETSPPQSAI